jgi:hypothetical protein
MSLKYTDQPAADGCWPFNVNFFMQLQKHRGLPCVGQIRPTRPHWTDQPFCSIKAR